MALKFGRLTIKAINCPWQRLPAHWSRGDTPSARYGWGRVPGMGRFGAGWQYKLGFQYGSRTLIIDWLFGSFRFDLASKS